MTRPITVRFAAATYAALFAFASPLLAADPATLEGLKAGDMKKLQIHAEPKPAGTAAFTTMDGETRVLADWQGKTVLLNFWATWCAPCRKEMPALDAVQAELGSDDFEVVVVATGRNSVEGIERFFDETNIENLVSYLDPKSKLGREMAVLGLPITVILDKNGDEIARLRGDADWHSEEAVAILRAAIGTGDS